MERKEYTRYSREFKLEAVRLAEIGERPKAQIARELGIRVNQLRIGPGIELRNGRLPCLTWPTCDSSEHESQRGLLG